MNNVFPGGGNPLTPIDNVSVEDLEFDNTLIKLVQLGTGGDPDKSWILGSGFNTLEDLTKGIGVVAYTKSNFVARDMTAHFIGGGFVPEGSAPGILFEENFTGAAGAVAVGNADTTGAIAATAGGVARNGSGLATMPAASYFQTNTTNGFSRAEFVWDSITGYGIPGFIVFDAVGAVLLYVRLQATSDTEKKILFIDGSGSAIGSGGNIPNGSAKVFTLVKNGTIYTAVFNNVAFAVSLGTEYETVGGVGFQTSDNITTIEKAKVIG